MDFPFDLTEGVREGGGVVVVVVVVAVGESTELMVWALGRRAILVEGTEDSGDEWVVGVVGTDGKEE
jgi:hypothetical protein